MTEHLQDWVTTDESEFLKLARSPDLEAVFVHSGDPVVLQVLNQDDGGHLILVHDLPQADDKPVYVHNNLIRKVDDYFSVSGGCYQESYSVNLRIRFVPCRYNNLEKR